MDCPWSLRSQQGRSSSVRRTKKRVASRHRVYGTVPEILEADRIHGGRHTSECWCGGLFSRSYFRVQEKYMKVLSAVFASCLFLCALSAAQATYQFKSFQNPGATVTRVFGMN